MSLFKFCPCLSFNLETHVSSAELLASGFTSLIQVLEMKEIEETKPSTSSSGRVLLMTLCCHAPSYLVQYERLHTCFANAQTGRVAT